MSNHRTSLRGRVYRRGYLPHVEAGSVPQFVTFRLADALPGSVMERFKLDVADLPKMEQEVVLSRRVDDYLDEGHGSCVLRETEAASCVEQALRHFDGARYRLHAWVIMPNHVHSALTPLEGQKVRTIVGSWKRYTAVRINRMIGSGGRLWQRSMYDRVIRDERHFKEVVSYIHNNPVKAGLCEAAEDWPCTSARERWSFKECR